MFRRQVGIDLGSSTTRIFVKGRGVVLREPSVVALSGAADEVVAVGHDVAQLEAANPAAVSVYPLRDDRTIDIGLTEALLTTLMRRAKLGPQPEVVMCLPAATAETEKRAVLSVVRKVAREVIVFREPLAAVLGAGISADDAGAMVVNIGGGSTEVALIRRSTLVVAETLRAAGNEFDEAVVRLMRQKGVLIGSRAAEAVKVGLGAALQPPGEEVQSRAVRGRDIDTGAPKTASVNAKEVVEALQGPLHVLAKGVQRVLETAPPDLAAHIFERNLTVTGGGSLLRYLDDFLQRHMGIPVVRAEHPADCTILGLGRALDLPDLRARSGEEV